MTSESIRSLLRYAEPALERELEAVEKAEAQSMSMRDAIAATRKMLGMDPARRSWEPEEIRRAKALYEQGFTYAQIGRALGRNHSSTARIVKLAREGT